MRKLYNEFFYIPKHGKICEKVMLAHVAMTVVTMVVCLAAMGITAYAYFSYNVTSGSNIIKAANFETQVQVQIADVNGEPVEVITSNHKSHMAALKANTEYYITLQHTDRSTAKTGFVIITADKCNSRYHTQQLGKDGDGNTEIITFWLKPNADTKVTFLCHWGTSFYYPDFKEIGENSELYIVNNEHIALSIIGATGTTSTGASSTESTTSSKTEPTTTQNTLESMGTSEPVGTTESAATEPKDATASTETQHTEETTSATTEVND